jgi:hypothetical protein
MMYNKVSNVIHGKNSKSFETGGTFRASILIY